MSSSSSEASAYPNAGTLLGRELSTRTIMFHTAIAERLGLNPTDHKALGLIHEAGTLTAGELADLSGLTTGAITGVIDRLEKAGYVERIRDRHDRRKVLIQPIIHPEHEQLLKGVFDPLMLAMTGIMERYNEQERAAIIDFVQRSIEVLQQETDRLRAENEQLKVSRK